MSENQNKMASRIIIPICLWICHRDCLSITHKHWLIVDTMVFLIDLYFTLRSGQSTNSASQISCLNHQEAYLFGLSRGCVKDKARCKHIREVPKEVVYYSNQGNPSQSFVCFHKEYLCHGPPSYVSVYSTPLKVPKSEIWFFWRL